MPIKINGTNTAANPSITGSDTDTGIVYGSDQIDLSTGGSSKVTLNGSNLGVGTTSPASPLHSHLASSDANRIRVTNSTTGATASDGFIVGLTSAEEGIVWNYENTAMLFGTNNTEHMRIKNDGRIAIGSDATPNGGASITTNYLQATTGQGMLGIVSNQTAHPDNTNNIPALARSINGSVTRQCYIGTRKVSTNNPAGFLYIQQRDGGNSHIWADNSAKIRTSNDAAQIGGTGGTVVGTQTSDIRLKNNLGSVSYGLTEINKITPIKYTFKKDESSRQQIGFSAQDIQSIIPESVYDTEETVEVEGTEIKNTLAMEYVALVPVLVNAVKELSAEVTTLKTKVAALEAA